MLISFNQLLGVILLHLALRHWTPIDHRRIYNVLVRILFPVFCPSNVSLFIVTLKYLSAVLLTSLPRLFLHHMNQPAPRHSRKSMEGAM